MEQILEDLLRLRRSVYNARNKQLINDETASDVLKLLDCIELILREALDGEHQ